MKLSKTCLPVFLFLAATLSANAQGQKSRPVDWLVTPVTAKAHVAKSPRCTHRFLWLLMAMNSIDGTKEQSLTSLKAA